MSRRSGLNKRDWSLVLFTCLSQASIGIILWLLIVHGLSYGGDWVSETGLAMRNPVLIALVLMGVATFISFLHLGSPQNAPYSLSNLAGSWLSREILFINLYAASLLLIFALGWHSGDVNSLGTWITLSSLLGLALLWMMIRIYVMPTIPTWNTWYTPLSFVCTTVSLGAVIMLLLETAASVHATENITRLLLPALIIILSLELLSSVMHHASIQKIPGGLQKPEFRQGRYYQVHILRTVILAVTIIGMIFVHGGLLPVSANIEYPWLVLCLALIISQELLGRLLFYASYFRIGF